MFMLLIKINYGYRPSLAAFGNPRLCLPPPGPFAEVHAESAANNGADGTRLNRLAPHFQQRAVVPAAQQ
jgi:hypothetical protein